MFNYDIRMLGKEPLFMVNGPQGVAYYLKQARPATNGARRVYYFSPNLADGITASLPSDFEVAETRTGLPILRRKQATRARLI